MLRPTPGDPWSVEQHHWNTGAEENQQLNPGGPSNRQNWLPLLVKNGLIDGQKLADLHPPAQLSIKHLFMDFLFRLPISFVFETFPNFLMTYTSEIYLKASFS